MIKWGGEGKGWFFGVKRKKKKKKGLNFFFFFFFASFSAFYFQPPPRSCSPLLASPIYIKIKIKSFPPPSAPPFQEVDT